MKRRNGFTTIELIITITITLVIVGFIMQILLVLKELYVSTAARTELLIRQSLISRQINNDLNKYAITQINNCGNECIEITLASGVTKELSINRTDKILKYGDYAVKLVDNSEFGEALVESETIYDVADDHDNTIIQIKIPITYPIYEDEDFGINIIYQYDSRIITIEDFSFTS